MVISDAQKNKKSIKSERSQKYRAHDNQIDKIQAQPLSMTCFRLCMDATESNSNWRLKILNIELCDENLPVLINLDPTQTAIEATHQQEIETSINFRILQPEQTTKYNFQCHSLLFRVSACTAITQRHYEWHDTIDNGNNNERQLIANSCSSTTQVVSFVIMDGSLSCERWYLCYGGLVPQLFTCVEDMLWLVVPHVIVVSTLASVSGTILTRSTSRCRKWYLLLQWLLVPFVIVDGS